MLRRKFLTALGTLALAGALAFAGAPTYFPSSIGDYDGTNDYLVRTSDLTGNADGKTGIVSLWFQNNQAVGSTKVLIQNTGSDFTIQRHSSGPVRVYARNIGASPILVQYTNTSFGASENWFHLLASWDLGNVRSDIYVNDVSDDIAASPLVDNAIDYTNAEWAVSSTTAGGNKWNGALAEVYLNVAEYLDITIESNRRKFIDASGYPVDLGPSGYKPTGTAPIIYMRTQYNNAGLNSGTGGDFTITGAPTYTVGPVPFPLTTWAPACGGRGLGGRGGRAAIH